MSNSSTSATFSFPPWRLRKLPDELVRAIGADTGLPAPLARALAALGLEAGREVKEFIEPSFENWLHLKGFPSLKKGSDLLFKALMEGRKVCVHGDFDTDGVLAAVILTECLQALGFAPMSYLPSRGEGHGISEESVRRIKEMGAEVIVTVDCGISAVGAARLARELGMALVITDHHLPDSELPDADAIINPQLDDLPEFKILSGAGVSLKLSLEIANRLPPGRTNTARFKAFLQHSILLSAIATIGDVVPLRGDNRALVRHALTLLGSVTWPGLKCLLEASGLKGQASAEDLAFQLIPRLNAAQRMEQGQLVWQLFTCSEEPVARDICKRLSKLNEERKSHQAEHCQSAISRLERELADQPAPPCIFVSGDNWREGISGLIANKVAEKFHRPAVVLLLKEGVYQASMRAPSGYRSKDALDECAHLLLSHGGHHGAAGFRISPEAFVEFKERFSAILESQYRQLLEGGHTEQQTVMIVDDIPWAELSHELVEHAGRLEPFGHGNSKPVYASRAVQIDGQPKFIGRDGEHVLASFHVPGLRCHEAIGFGLRRQFEALDRFGKVDIAYNLGKGKYGNKIQLNLVAVRQHREKSS